MMKATIYALAASAVTFNVLAEETTAVEGEAVLEASEGGFEVAEEQADHSEVDHSHDDEGSGEDSGDDGDDDDDDDLDSGGSITFSQSLSLSAEDIECLAAGGDLDYDTGDCSLADDSMDEEDLKMRAGRSGRRTKRLKSKRTNRRKGSKRRSSAARKAKAKARKAKARQRWWSDSDQGLSAFEKAVRQLSTRGTRYPSRSQRDTRRIVRKPRRS